MSYFHQKYSEKLDNFKKKSSLMHYHRNKAFKDDDRKNYGMMIN